jgi:hypothetical protein
VSWGMILRIFGSKREEETRSRRQLYNDVVYNLYSSENKAHESKKEIGMIL